MSFAASFLHPPGLKFASSSSESAKPGGQYLRSFLGKVVSLNIRKLWSATTALVIPVQRSGVALIGRLNILHRAVDMPKVFSLTRRALEKL